MFGIVLFLGLAALAVSADEASTESNYIFSLYDSKAQPMRNNTLYYEEFNKNFSKNGQYTFSEFTAGFNHNSEYPVLVTYQPVESKKELHGYYFPNGLLSLLAYREGDPATYELYRPVREYLLNSSTEAVIPYAATYVYPYFYEQPLVKFVYTTEVAPKFAVLFVAPKQCREETIEDYKEVARFYNDKKSTIITTRRV